MQVSGCSWHTIEEYLKGDDRCIVPIGCTEQHAYLSLSTDTILAARIASDAAEPLGIPVFPVMPYGATPQFMAYPGTVTLRLSTLFLVVEDILDSLTAHGFRRILIVNGHGGNNPVANFVQEWMSNKWRAGNTDVSVKFHSWWNAPKTWAKVQEIDPVASHASWMENFPWTRLPGISSPKDQKTPVDPDRLRMANPKQARELLQDGNFAGYFARSDEDMMAIWQVAVDETRALLDDWK